MGKQIKRICISANSENQNKINGAGKGHNLFPRLNILNILTTFLERKIYARCKNFICT